MRNLIIFSALTLGFAQASLALGQENEGEPAAKMEVTCGTGDGALELKIEQLGNEKNVAIVKMESTGGGLQTFSYDITEDTHQGLLGAGIDYKGRNFSLHLATDLAPSPKGISSTLSISDLGFENESLYCHF